MDSNHIAAGHLWCTESYVQLVLIADYGVEQAVPVNGLDSQAIESKLQELIQHGESLPRFVLQALTCVLFQACCRKHCKASCRSTESDGELAA